MTFIQIDQIEWSANQPERYNCLIAIFTEKSISSIEAHSVHIHHAWKYLDMELCLMC